MNITDIVVAAAGLGGAKLTVSREDPVPDGITSRSTLEIVHYADQFSLAGDLPDRSPERWACTILEDSAGALGQLVWRGPVGLRLRRGPDRIAGWAVAARDEESIVMHARGRLLTAELVIRASPKRASVATLIRYDHAIATVIWPALAVAHRAGLPVLLRRACAARR